MSTGVGQAQREHETSGVADSSTVLLGRSGDYASAGNRSVSKRWRMAHPSLNGGDDGSGQRVWTKRWRALRHFALDGVDKLMERGLGKNVDDHGASCLVAPGVLAGVDGRVVPRPEMESDCESGSKGSSARYTNKPDASGKRTGNSDGDQTRLTDGGHVTRSAIQLLPLLEEALMAVETAAGTTMAMEPLREEKS